MTSSTTAPPPAPSPAPVPTPSGPHAGSDRPEDRTAATRRRVLDAAHRSILTYGPSRTSMVDVARTAGVGRTTVYRYWARFEDLLADLMTREFLAAVDALATSPRSAEEAAAAITGVAAELRASPLLDAIRRHEPTLLAVYCFSRLGATQLRLRELIAETLSEAARRDERMTAPDPLRTASVLLVTIQGAVLSAPLIDDHVDPATWAAELRRLVTGYLLAPEAPR